MYSTVLVSGGQERIGRRSEIRGMFKVNGVAWKNSCWIVAAAYGLVQRFWLHPGDHNGGWDAFQLPPGWRSLPTLSPVTKDRQGQLSPESVHRQPSKLWPVLVLELGGDVHLKTATAREQL